MTPLPSPIPHPLDACLLDVPPAAREVIEWLVGRGWPAGDEAATWDLADRWYALALDGPRDAVAAAAAGIGGDGFRDAWHHLTGTPGAPLDELPVIAHDLGELVEGCARDLEAAKLEALIEIGLLLTELTALAITAPLTLGAAAPAADGVIAATRISLQEVFDRLAQRLAGGMPARPTRHRRPPTTAASATGMAVRTIGGVPAGAPGRGPRNQAPDAAGPPRRGRHARDTGDSRATTAPRSPSLEITDAGPGTVTREISPSELDQMAQALVRRDRGNVVGYSRDAGRPTVPNRRTKPRTADQATGPAEHNAGDRVPRLPDPRVGQWFRLAHAGLNCVDSVLALFDTYQRGNTFAGYTRDEPGAEWLDVRRIEHAVGAEFQNLCPFLRGADPADAKAAVDAAMLNLANHLHNSGHGSFAFIVTDLEAGRCHAWAAVNQDGDILFLDPHEGRISEETPLYAHRGAPAAGNIVAMDALVVDSRGRPAPLPFHGPGLRTGAEG